MSKLIYIIDDEPDILELVEMNLVKAGFTTEAFSHGKILMQALSNRLPDLLILDLMLPDMDGLEICRQIRSRKEFKKLPIVMLTAKVELDEKIEGLDSGADDYITKPFSPQELISRVRAVLRRSEWETVSNILTIADNLKIDLHRFEVSVDNTKVDLTLTEFKILQILTKRPGWVYSRSQLLDYLWGDDKIVTDRTIDVHVKNLREKIGRFGQFIRNIRGIGYKFDTETDLHGNDQEQIKE